MIPQLRNAGIDVGGTVNTALDAIGPIVQVLGLVYATYGRIVGSTKPAPGVS
jgi:hypothetical protein